MSPNPKSSVPERRLGVYKRLCDVPDKYRLYHYHDDYEGCDTWCAFVEAELAAYDSDHYQATVRKAGESWTAHLSDRGRHHALAKPIDVVTWCEALVDSRTLRTVYKEYFVRIEEFYWWLLYRVDHPHVYQPVLMAANNYELVRQVWDAKFDHRSSGGRNE